MPLVLLALFGCPASTLDDYEAARAQALARPPALGNTWEPDAVLHLSAELVDELARTSMASTGTIGERVSLLGGAAWVHPKLEVRSVTTAQPSASCADCLGLDVTLGGDVEWSAVGRSGELPTTIQAGVDLRVRPEQVKRTWTVVAKLRGVREVDVELGRLPSAVQQIAEKKVGEQIRQGLQETPSWSMSAIDGSSLPVRAARVAPSPAGIRVDMLTEASTPEPVDAQAKLARGWRLDVSPDSLVDLARAESFRAGPVSHDVVVDPTRFAVGHDSFELDLRLWKTTGSGWWRDYTVTGDLTRARDRFALKAKEVEQTGSSAGAAVADPLAYLGEGVILDSIEENVRGAFPAGSTTFARGHRWVSSVRAITGSAERLTVTGDIEVEEVKKRKGTGRPRAPRSGR